MPNLNTFYNQKPYVFHNQRLLELDVRGMFKNFLNSSKEFSEYSTI